jgi:hypothetical protein
MCDEREEEEEEEKEKSGSLPLGSLSTASPNAINACQSM